MNENKSDGKKERLQIWLVKKCKDLAENLAKVFIFFVVVAKPLTSLYSGHVLRPLRQIHGGLALSQMLRLSVH